MSITPIVSKITPLSTTKTEGTLSTAAENVENTFSNILKNLESTQETSDNLLSDLSSGKDVDLSQLMIATQETDISFRVAMSIRDKLVDAYTQISRTTV
jgi:flagellar hook-basal body complex protein FliE